MSDSPVYRVLVVDDDAPDRAMMVQALRSPSHDVVEAVDAAEAQAVLARHEVDLMVLDLLLPDRHGLEFLSTLRVTYTLPVVVVSGVTAVSERVAALRMGADDVLVKPVDPEELSARCAAVLRRSNGAGRRSTSTEQVIRGPGFTLDLIRRDVVVDGMSVELTPLEFDMLAHLAARDGAAVSRTELGREVWKAPADRSVDATVTEHVRRLRNKIGDGANGRNRLRTVRGVGYRLVL